MMTIHLPSRPLAALPCHAIVDAIPTITLADVHVALAYSWDNQEDLDRQMEMNSAEADEYRRQIDDGRLARKRLQRLG